MYPTRLDILLQHVLRLSRAYELGRSAGSKEEVSFSAVEDYASECHRGNQFFRYELRRALDRLLKRDS